MKRVLRIVWIWGGKIWIGIGFAVISAMMVVAALLLVDSRPLLHSVTYALITRTAHVIMWWVGGVYLGSLLLYGCELPKCLRTV